MEISNQININMQHTRTNNKMNNLTTESFKQRRK